jgi:hypothetical protein
MASAVQAVVAPHAAHTEEKYIASSGGATRTGTFTPDTCAATSSRTLARVRASRRRPRAAAPTLAALPPSPAPAARPHHPSLPGGAARIVNAIRGLFRARTMQARRARGGRPSASTHDRTLTSTLGLTPRLPPPPPQDYCEILPTLAKDVVWGAPAVAGRPFQQPSPAQPRAP